MNRIVFCIFLILGIFSGSLLLWDAGSHTFLVVDATISSGSSFSVSFNGRGSPLRVPIAAAKRQEYVFSGIPAKFTTLQLDPTDVRHAAIAIHSIQIRRDGETLWRLVPPDLAESKQYGLQIVGTDHSAARFVSLSNNPMIIKDVNVTVQSVYGFVARYLSYCDKGAIQLWSLLFLGLSLFLVTRRKGDGKATAWAGILVAISYPLGWLACQGILGLGGDIPAVDQAVGHAAFTGKGDVGDFRAFWATVIAIGAWTCGCLFFRHRASAPAFEHGVDHPVSDTPEARWGILSLFVFVCAVLTFPDLEAHHRSVSGVVHSTNYDSQNIQTWTYFRHLGLLPFRDFWYPYGGFFYLQLPFPPDALYRWLHWIAYVVACGFSIYCLTNYSVVRSLLVIAIFLFMYFIDLLPAIDRYLLAPSVVLVCALALTLGRRPIFLVSGVYIAYVFFMEANQVIYAGPGCLLLIVYAFCRLRGKTGRRDLLVNLLITASSALGPIVVYLLLLKKNGALPEYLLFFRTMGQMADYSRLPAHLPDWFKTPWTVDSIYFYLVISLLPVSLWSFWSRPYKKREIADLVPLALFLVAAISFQKQLVRSPVSSQLLAVPVMGFALLTARTQFHRVRGGGIGHCLAGLVAGFFIGFIIVGSGTATKMVEMARQKIKALPRHFVSVAGEKPDWEKVRGEYFNPRKFYLDGMRGDEFYSRLAEKMAIRRRDDVFVLGDDPYIYILLQQQAPFYITFYNQSILHSQERTVRWLEEHKPSFVIWKSSFTEFDQVPHAVRVPLLFRHVMGNYVYSDRVGPYLILKRLLPEGKGVLDFWRGHLGETVDLGFIPSRSNPQGDPAGSGDGTFRYTVMTLYNPHPVHGRSQELIFTIEGRPYRITFREQGGVNRYSIVLDRIWFLQLARQLGFLPHLETGRLNLNYRLNSVDLKKNILY